MNLATLIAALVSSQWSTNCVMTQADGQQGFAIDTVTFEKSDLESTDTLKVFFSRTWFKDGQCSISSASGKSTEGTVSVGKKMQTMAFPGAITETIYEADFTLDKKVGLGAIAIANDEKSIRMTTTSFGTARNTMLSLFRYFVK